MLRLHQIQRRTITGKHKATRKAPTENILTRKKGGKAMYDKKFQTYIGEPLLTEANTLYSFNEITVF